MICLGFTMKEKESKKVLHLIQERLDRIILINKKTTRERMRKEVTEDNNSREIRIDRAQVEEMIKDKKDLPTKSLTEIKEDRIIIKVIKLKEREDLFKNKIAIQSGRSKLKMIKEIMIECFKMILTNMTIMKILTQNIRISSNSSSSNIKERLYLDRIIPMINNMKGKWNTNRSNMK